MAVKGESQFYPSSACHQSPFWLYSISCLSRQKDSNSVATEQYRLTRDQGAHGRLQGDSGGVMQSWKISGFIHSYLNYFIYYYKYKLSSDSWRQRAKSLLFPPHTQQGWHHLRRSRGYGCLMYSSKKCIYKIIFKIALNLNYILKVYGYLLFQLC